MYIRFDSENKYLYEYHVNKIIQDSSFIDKQRLNKIILDFDHAYFSNDFNHLSFDINKYKDSYKVK